MDKTTPAAPAYPPPVAIGGDAKATPDGRLRRRWLGPARAIWAITAVLALGVLVASIPGYTLVASQGDWAGRAVAAPAGLVRALDLAGALASFAAALVCLALSGLLVWRTPDNGMALFVSFYLLVYGVVMAGPLERLEALVPGSSALATDVLQPLVFTWPTVALLALFPNGRLVPRWTRWLLLLAVPSMVLLLYITNIAMHWSMHASPWLIWPAGTCVFLTLGAAVYAQVWRYRRVSSAIERQQTKWVVFGLAVWGLLVTVDGVPFLLWINLPASAALPWWVPVSALSWWLALDIVPLALTIAVLRFRLFDLGVLIRLTLVYGTLTAILGAIYFAVVLGAQAMVRVLTGEAGEQPLVIVATTLLVASLVTRARRRVQATIDRRFYRRKYDAERTLAAFSQTLRGEVDLEQLGGRLLATVEETMQPTHASLWLRPSAERAVRR
jgi:hypothetical protein